MISELLFSFVVSISNPASAPADVYVADSNLTLEDCADRIRAGVSSVELDDGRVRQIGSSDYALTCERQESVKSDSSEEPQAEEPEFISTGNGTFKTSWGESRIDGLAEEPESKPVKRKTRKARKRK